MSAPRTALLALSLCCATAHAGAQEASAQSPWSLRLGYANASFSTAATLDLAGAPVPGAAARVADKRLLFGDLNYALAPGWTARVAFAPPPTVTLHAAGSLRAWVPPLSGTVGKVRFAPVVLTATWAPAPAAALSPYVGIGANYAVVMKTSDGDVAGIEADNAWGGALQAGADWALDRRWALFVDVRKLYLKTSGRGRVTALGGLPAEGEVAFDPLIVTAGIGYRF